MPDPLRDVFLAFARVHILHHASEKKIFGVWMMRELAHHGYRLGPGTLYPLLHRLEEEEMLACETVVVEGKARKYYSITKKGRAALARIRPKLGELVREVHEAKATDERTSSSGVRRKSNGKTAPTRVIRPARVP